MQKKKRILSLPSFIHLNKIWTFTSTLYWIFYCMSHVWSKIQLTISYQFFFLRVPEHKVFIEFQFICLQWQQHHRVNVFGNFIRHQLIKVVINICCEYFQHSIDLLGNFNYHRCSTDKLVWNLETLKQKNDKQTNARCVFQK